MAKILIVDDNEQNLYLLRVLLSTNGYEVIEGSNGVEALAAARKNIPDLLITDILMPSMDGFSLCRVWKNDEDLKDIPLIFYTATYTDKKDEEFALSLGAERFVVKPQTPVDLLSIIQEVLKTHSKKNTKQKIDSPNPKEDEYYKGYNEALVRKLEKKMLQIEKSNKCLNSLYQVSCDLVKIENPIDIIQRVMNAVHEITGYQKAVYFQYDEKTDSLLAQEALGFLDTSLAIIQEKLVKSTENGTSLVAETAKSRQTLSIKDTSKDSRWTVANNSIKSALYIPVQYEQKLLGVLGLFSSEIDTFSEDEKNIVALTNSLAISIVNKQTEEKVMNLNLDLENRIRERTNQLQSSNNDLEAFAYSVSHDLRAPLRAIEGYSTVLVEEYGKQLDAEGVRILNTVCQNIQQMDKFITDLLALSKVSLQEKNYSIISMSAIVSDVITEIQKHDKDKKVQIEIEPLPDVYADPVLIRQVWDNLLNNAMKYSNLKTEPRIRIASEDKDEMVVFSIEDNGIGFSQEIAQNLFHPFQRLYTEDQFEGTGIGLTIVKRIIDRHGGQVWAEGKQDKGAKFFFSLPKQIK